MPLTTIIARTARLTAGLGLALSPAPSQAAGPVRGDDPTSQGVTIKGAAAPDQFHFPVEVFTAAASPFDLAFRSIEFRPRLVNGEHRYLASVREVDALPVDPAGGTALFLEGTQADNDAQVEVAFADGRDFPLYNASGATIFESVHISTNGYLTFGEGDTSPTPDLDGFFEFVRVSALWSDLDPWRGGTLSYRQFDDRFVVTWSSMPRYLHYDSNTAQIELRFDGVIVITWLEVGAPDTIVGISPVALPSGAPKDFAPSDLTVVGGSLDPRPPSAVGSFVRTGPGTPISVSLRAEDDGLPYGFLRYWIVRLPSAGALRDEETGHVLSMNDLPYSLGVRGQITFEPPSDTWTGNTSFEFIASDLWPELGFTSMSPAQDPAPNDGDSTPGAVVVQADEPHLVRSFLVDDTLDTSEWTGLSPGGWEFGQPTGGSLQPNSNDPTSGFTGQNVLGYNLDGDFTDSLPAQHVISPVIDCSDFSGVRLRFMRWLCVQVSPDDNAALAVSADGVTWTEVWHNPATSTLLDRGWRTLEYDISSIADGQSTVYLRWTMGPTDVSGRFAGWNIDDIRVLGFLAQACPGDVTADGVVNASDLFAVLAGVGPIDQTDPHDLNGDGVVDGEDALLVVANFGRVCY